MVLKVQPAPQTQRCRKSSHTLFLINPLGSDFWLLHSEHESQRQRDLMGVKDRPVVLHTGPADLFYKATEQRRSVRSLLDRFHPGVALFQTTGRRWRRCHGPPEGTRTNRWQKSCRCRRGSYCSLLRSLFLFSFFYSSELFFLSFLFFLLWFIVPSLLTQILSFF